MTVTATRARSSASSSWAVLLLVAMLVALLPPQAAEAAPGPLSGVVTLPGDPAEPAHGSAVEVWTHDGGGTPWTRYSTSTSGGEYSFDTGSWETGITHWVRAVPSQTDGTHAPSVAVPVTVDAAGDVRVGGADSATLDLVLRIANVTGTVRYPAAESTVGEPVQGTRVRVSGGSVEEFPVQTDVDGRFGIALDFADPVSYELVADGVGHYFASLPRVASGPEHEVELVLRAPNVSGSVVEPDQQPYLGSASVEARVDGQFHSGNQTDSSGTYGMFLEAPTAGTRVYELQAVAWGDPSFLSSRAIDVVVNEAGQLSLDGASFSAALEGVDLQLRTPNVTGVVRAPGGAAYTDQANVEVRTGHEGMQGASTRDDGSYGVLLEAPADGTRVYELQAVAWGDPSVAPSTVVEVTVDSTGQVSRGGEFSASLSGLDLILRAPNVTGVVVGPDGQPFTEQVSVEVRSGQDHVPGTWTREDGSYALLLEPPTSGERVYDVQAVVWGHPSVVSSPVVQVTVNAEGAVSVEGSGFAAPPAGVELKLRAPNVSGLVLGGDDLPYTGNAWVEVRSGQDHVPGPSTQSDGSYSLLLEPPSEGTRTYELQAQAADDPSVVASDVVEVTVAADGQVSRDGGATFSPALSDLDLALRAPNVTGTVVDPDGQPVPHAEVQIRTRDHTFHGWASADESGAFGLLVENAGSYVVTASPRWDSAAPLGRSAETNVTVEDVDGVLTVTSPAGPLQIQLRWANVSGTVTDPSGQPVENASVQIRSRDGSYHDWSGTDREGTFRLALEPGEYIFVADPAWGSVEHGRSVETTVTVSDTGVDPSPLTLALTTPNVTGSVVDAAGAPLTESTHVEIRTPDYTFYSHVNTDQSGRFALTLADGTYLARGMPPWNGRQTPSVETELRVADNVLVEVAGEPFAPDTDSFLLALTSPAIDGRACAPVASAASDGCDGNTPVGHGWATLRTFDWSFQVGTSVRSDGTYSFGGVPDGEYLLDVFPPWDRSDLMPVTEQPVTVSASAGVLAVDSVYGLADETIEVTILDPEGRPITTGGFWVHAFNRSGSFAEDRDGPTDAGVYEIAVSAGLWDVAIQAKNSDSPYIYTGYSKTVAVDEGVTTPVTFSTVAADALVQGSIADPAGRPLAMHTQNSAWVEVRSSDGRGNGGELIACDGSIQGSNNADDNCFSVRVPAGTYSLHVHPFNAEYGSPQSRTIKVGPEQTLTVDGDAVAEGVQPLRLTSRDGRIQGRVAYRSGSPVGGAEVSAWQPGGGSYANTRTAADGSYTLKVSPGEWEIGVWPKPGETWSYNGSPRRVSIATEQTVTGQNFEVRAAVATIEGRLRHPDGTTAKSDAYVWLQDASTGHGNGGPVINGTFSVPVPAGVYELRVHLAPGGSHAAPAPVTVGVSSEGTITTDGMTLPLSLELLAADRTVTGVLTDPQGTPITDDLSGSYVVTATKDTGEHIETQLVRDGGVNSYRLEVSGGVWSIGFYPSAPSSYARLGVAGESTVDLTGDVSATRDLRIVAADRTLSGTVVDSDGSPVPYAWVSADATSESPYPTVRRNTTAAADGTFTVSVPAGTYRLGAAADLDGHQRPRTVTIATDPEPGPVTLAFQLLTSSISGVVRHGGQGASAKIDAWSDTGGYATTTADGNGSYVLAVSGDDVWHVSAVDPAGGTATTVLVSDVVDVPLEPAASASGVDLTLASVAVPSAVTRKFDAASSQVLTIGGVTLTVPAGALDTSGEVSVIARPNAKPGTTADTKPIGLGYVFEAFDLTDAEGNPQQKEIATGFNKALRISFGYDQAQLDELGLAPVDLVPAYWDESTSSYRRIESVTVDEANQTITFSVDHFTNFVIASTGPGSEPASASPTVTGVSPTSSVEGVATDVSIAGTGFTSGAAATVGGQAATGITVVSSTRIDATVPGLPVGSHDVVVRNSDGRSGTLSGGYRVVAAAGGGDGGGDSGGGGSGGGAGGGTGAVDSPDPGSAPGGVSGELEPGETLSTDPDGVGTSPDVPVQVAVTSPQGGEVTISMRPATGTASGYRFVGSAVDISAPAATPQEPIRLVFTVDRSVIPSGDPLVVFRDGVIVTECQDDAAGVADPDPCVASHLVSRDHDELAVLTTATSVWHLGAVDVTSLEIACPAADTPAGLFGDVPTGHAHARGIDCVSDWAVARGLRDGTFRPARMVTRAQMASFLVRVLAEAGVALPEDADVAFTDIAGNTHEEAIGQLAVLGVVRGKTETTYAPQAEVARSEMASLMVRTFELITQRPMRVEAAGFVDVAGGSTHGTAIEKVATIGFAAGTTPDTFAPSASVSRGQMATFLGRMLNRLRAEELVSRSR